MIYRSIIIRDFNVLENAPYYKFSIIADCNGKVINRNILLIYHYKLNE